MADVDDVDDDVAVADVVAVAAEHVAFDSFGSLDVGFGSADAGAIHPT